jgi:hypothetical protein
MVDVITSAVINCNCEKVAAFAANPDNAPEWYQNIKSIEWKSERPIQKGTLLAFKAAFLGRELAYTYEVKEWIPGKKMVMATSSGPFPMETTYTWEKIDAQTTRMTIRNQGNPSGFSKIFAPFMAFAMRKANEKDLRLLKSILEKQ